MALLWLSPLGSLSACLALLCIQSIAGYEFTQASVWAVVVASFATVAFDGWRRAVAAGFLVAAGMVIVLLTTMGVSWESALSTWVSLSVAWIIAIVIRVYRGSIERAERRAALFSADREARAREAVAEERVRLARELHDSVGHALNVVVLHAARRNGSSRPNRSWPERLWGASRRRVARRSATSSACSASCGPRRKARGSMRRLA